MPLRMTVRMPRSVEISQSTGISPPVMPPGVAGSSVRGSGASRVHRTNPSGDGAPAATPRLKGSFFHRGAGDDVHPTNAGAVAIPNAPAPTVRRKERRVSRAIEGRGRTAIAGHALWGRGRYWRIRGL